MIDSRPKSNSAGPKRLPGFIVIGAMKSGTTSLHEYLNLHPSIGMALVKETNYFTVGEYARRSQAWYESCFPEAENLILGEASPRYTFFPETPDVPMKMHKLIPDVKLIYIVRDPIKRFLSELCHQGLRGFIDFDSLLRGRRIGEFDKCQAVLSSRYYFQIKRYLEYFSVDQLLIVSQEDLLRARLETMQRIFKFLQVDENFVSDEFEILAHQGAAKLRAKTPMAKFLIRCGFKDVIKSMIPWSLYARGKKLFTKLEVMPYLDNKLEQALVEHFSPDVEAIWKIAGTEFAWSHFDHLRSRENAA